MAELRNPLAEEANPEFIEDLKGLFNRASYENMNGPRREVQFTGDLVKIEHGLGFTPDPARLTMRSHLAHDDVGTLLFQGADERYVYVRTPRAGKAWVEIAHPPRGSDSK